MMREDFGSQLRSRRERLGLSLRSVATEVGISASMLSQVETGKLYPSVSTLYQIAAFLDVSLDDLLGLSVDDSHDDSAQHESRRGPVQRAEDNPRIELELGVTWEQLAARPESGLQPLLVTFAPGAMSSTEERLLRHSGLEHGYLLEGQLSLRIGFERRIIRAGDSFCFDGAQPHLFVNESEEAAKGVWFVVPRDAETSSAQSIPPAGSRSAADALRALRNSI